MSKFSIITTTYRHEKYIRSTIQSIIDQTSSDWELYIGDDSPDFLTWNVISEFMKKYPKKIHAWKHEESKGIVGNTNFLLEKARGNSEYIIFLEGDDMLSLESLNKRNNIFSQFPEVSLVYSDLDYINSSGEITQTELLNKRGNTFYINSKIPVSKYILSRNSCIVSYSTVSVRSEVLYRFFPIRNITNKKMYSVSDYDLFFQISTNYPVYGIRESLTLYRRHVGNISSDYSGLFLDLILLIHHYFNTEIIPENVYHIKKSWIYCMLCFSYLLKGEKKQAYDSLIMAFKEDLTYGIFYKICVVCFLILPSNVTQKILHHQMRSGL